MTNNAAINNGIANKSDLPRMTLGERGNLGLKLDGGVLYEEYRKDLIWPNNIRTYKNMSLDPVVDSVMKVIRAYIRTVSWTVKPPENATEEQLRRAEFIESCMHDMDRSWSEYIQEFLSYLIYGFNVSEKVYKHRSTSKDVKYKSKFDDNLIGWAKLPTRSQDTIDRWVFDKEVRELIGARQNLNLVRNSVRSFSELEGKAGFITLPRSKFMLFRSEPTRDNPQGNSPLNGAYLAWRNKIGVEESEMIGASRDLVGTPMMRLPSQYLSPHATEAQVAFREEAERILRNIQVNEQTSVLLPSDRDEKGNELFTFELVGLQGGRQSNTDEIIKRLENKILMAFMADVLKAGQDTVGSFALADSKTALLAVGIESRLIELVDTLNNDLIPQTFELNGWTDTDYPKITYGDLEQQSLDEIGKLIQRAGAAGVLEGDKALSDHLRGLIGVEPADKTNKLDDDLVVGGNSKAGEGMKEGMPNGTGKSSGNNSATNSDNAE